jgi:phenylacetic acid degradation operon negative regulatory protein
VDAAELAGAGLVRLWRRLGRAGRLDVQVRTMEQAGMVARRGEGPFDERLFALTERGRQILSVEFDPESQWRRPWDGRWRFAMFDVPESRNATRARLRRTLRELRFGWLQNSVWLSPDPVPELVRRLVAAQISVESLLFIDGRPAAGESDQDLVGGAWDFGALQKAHAAYLKMLRLRPSLARGTLSDWQAWLAAEQRGWTKIRTLDPFLPEPLWPAGYAGRAVWTARLEALIAAGQAVRALIAS